jgi:hypothetical protein
MECRTTDHGPGALAIITTSQQNGRNPDPGGNPKGGYFAIRGDGKNWFIKDTWLLFEEPVELSASDLANAVTEGVCDFVNLTSAINFLA